MTGHQAEFVFYRQPQTGDSASQLHDIVKPDGIHQPFGTDGTMMHAAQKLVRSWPSTDHALASVACKQYT